MREFVTTALPLVCVGLALALIAIRFSGGKRDARESFLVECLCLGICLGVIWGGQGICYGMALGTALGCLIPKEKVREQG